MVQYFAEDSLFDALDTADSLIARKLRKGMRFWIAIRDCLAVGIPHSNWFPMRKQGSTAAPPNNGDAMVNMRNGMLRCHELSTFLLDKL